MISFLTWNQKDLVNPRSVITLTDKYNIVVTDILGKEIFSKFINGFSTENIDISDLERGVYLLEISNSDMRFSEKIILNN